MTIGTLITIEGIRWHSSSVDYFTNKAPSCSSPSPSQSGCHALNQIVAPSLVGFSPHPCQLIARVLFVFGNLLILCLSKDFCLCPTSGLLELSLGTVLIFDANDHRSLIVRRLSLMYPRFYLFVSCFGCQMPRKVKSFTSNARDHYK